MGLSRDMCWTSLGLLAFLVFSPLMSQASRSPLEVMLAPNLLRVGTGENIFVEIQDCHVDHDIDVTIKVMNHPTKTTRLNSTTVTLTKAKKHQNFARVTIPASSFSKDPNMKQYVYLQAQFPDRLLEKIVLVSFQSGFIFIQTDKPLYTPKSSVLYRVFGVTPGMKPVEENNADQMDTTVVIDTVTPDGIIAKTKQVSLQSGMHSGVYTLGEIASPGLWKIVVKFQDNPQQSFFAEFEVKEYVLPSFEVELTPLSPFFYVDSSELSVSIKAQYLFGEEVSGMAFVVFGVIRDGQKSSFPSSIQKVPIVGGAGEATLRREHITQTFPNINELVKKHIYVAVTVLTESGDEMVEKEIRSVQIVTSPYTIRFKRTPRFYKPRLSFDVTVEVLNPDESPASRVPVVVDPGQVKARTEANGMARLTISTVEASDQLQITARTDGSLTRERQASATMVALPHKSKSNEFIHIELGKTVVNVKEDVKINFIFSRQDDTEKDTTYLILSRGQLIKHGSLATRGQVLFSIRIPITKEMMPSFRIVAYYHTENNEVISDSVWVDVKHSCMGSLTLDQVDPPPYYEPRQPITLKITGDPGAKVGLVAVDKGVYVLNNKHRLTQRKVWDSVEMYDTGCTAGGGENSMGVFYDAGLLFKSSSSETDYRQELKCPTTSRRKRANTIMEVRASLLSQYEDKLQRECCSDGLKDTPVSYSCERRSGYIVEGQACAEAFLRCCREIASQRAERRVAFLHLARSEEDDGYEDAKEITSRTSFPESWLWLDIPLPSCPVQDPQCETTSASKKVYLQESITTWQFTGISLSRTHGICVADALKVVVKKKFFIDLKLPYSAVRGEQLEIKAVLHNYNTETVTVRVDLIEHTDLCSAASKRGKYRQEVTVQAQATRSVSYVIIPMKEGEVPVEVKAFVKYSYQLGDAIKKNLRVVSQGVLIKSPKVLTIHPEKLGVGGRQELRINSEINIDDMVPHTATSTLISVTGREQMSSLVEKAISGHSLTSLIQMPSGCGEQNAAAMTLPAIATSYLDKTNQWESVGLGKRDEALQHIRTGYQNELGFRNNDGSFSVFEGSKGSSWLTAYVVKVFAMISTMVTVQRDVICDAVRFLILNAQLPDGMFIEIGRVYSREMRGGVLDANTDVSMTAFCLIAMQESQTICGNSVTSLANSMNKAADYIGTRLPGLTNPYAVAITSYALANRNTLNLEILNKFVSEGSHWRVPGSQQYTLEATAYALLALVKAGDFEKAKPVVRWIGKQQSVNGDYGSTQATIMVYQAVAEYWANAREPDYHLNVDILLPGRSQAMKLNFNKNTQFATRTSKFNDINQDVQVTATGTGEATLTMMSLYYALPKEKASDCQKFDLSVRVTPENAQGNEMIYKLSIEVLFKDPEHSSTMAILDIGLPTGFIANREHLKTLSEGHARTISRYEMNTVLSEKGSLIIYLEKVSNERPEEITFNIHQKWKVGVLQPAAVSVYEYNEKEQCVKFYHPERSGALRRLCPDNECVCAEENCSMQKKGKISDNERTNKVCETTKTNIIDFAYKISIEGFSNGSTADIHTARILQDLKKGTTDEAPRGKLRNFLSFPHCREALGLTEGKTYLIMGSSKDIRRLHETQSYQYALGENTWVEYWPTNDECQTDKYRHTCLGMEELVEIYEVFGCPK